MMTETRQAALELLHNADHRGFGLDFRNATGIAPDRILAIEYGQTTPTESELSSIYEAVTGQNAPRGGVTLEDVHAFTGIPSYDGAMA